jgi:hypothetical protein
MSQKKVDKHKYEKNNRKKIEKKKQAKKLAWIFAGCIVLGGCLGFILGKFWLYPIYREKQGYYVELNEDQQEQSDWNNEVLQQLNSQMEENIVTEEGADVNFQEADTDTDTD